MIRECMICDGQRVERPAMDTEFRDSFDVVVCGLGTAGAMAAIFAGQNGLRVLGIETFNCVGGTSTIGGVDGHYFGTPGGRFEQVDNRIAAFEKEHSRSHIEARKLVQEQCVLEQGVEILYESRVIGVYMEGSRVIGVKAVTPEGVCSFRAKVVLDCTGDALVADMAGCACEFGRKTDGLTQPYTMVSLLRKGTDIYTTNCDFGRVDQRDDRALSRALIFSRAYQMREEGAPDNRVIHVPLLGVREGRRIVAEETITLEDLFAGRKTATPVYYAYADLDKHGWDIAFDGPMLGDWAIGANLGAYNVTVPVSYKTIIPKAMDGILVPCRGLGVDRDIASCVRMVPDMKKLAEAAADMALLAIRHNCPLRDIPYEELKDRLLESGCLNPRYDRGVRIDGLPTPAVDVIFPEEPERLEEILSTRTPGQAIWAAGQMGSRAVPTLKKLLDSPQEDTRKHAAFALAMAGDRSAIDVLREMVRSRDSLTLKDCRKHNQQRICIAIYHLGRLADEGIADTLLEMITDPEEYSRDTYRDGQGFNNRYEVMDFRNRWFQALSNAMIALVRIGDANPHLREKISRGFRAAFQDDAYYRRVTARPLMSNEGGMVSNIKTVAFRAAEAWSQGMEAGI